VLCTPDGTEILLLQCFSCVELMNAPAPVGPRGHVRCDAKFYCCSLLSANIVVQGTSFVMDEVFTGVPWITYCIHFTHLEYDLPCSVAR